MLLFNVVIIYVKFYMGTNFCLFRSVCEKQTNQTLFYYEMSCFLNVLIYDLTRMKLSKEIKFYSTELETKWLVIN